MTLQEAIKTLEKEYLGDSENMELAKQMGAIALEKQIPKKPIGKTETTFGDVCIVCPNCENRGLANPFAKSRVYDYCPKCGQALDWSDTYDQPT